MRFIFVIFITFFVSFSVSASHISGVNISYVCLGDDEYTITVNLFRDCQDLNFLPAHLNVFIESSCSNLGYVQFPQIDLTEVSQLCDEQMPYSTCNGGFQPGAQRGVYELNVELPPCSDWRIIVSEQNRDGAIVNLQNPELYSLHTEAFLNNSNGDCNSSPELSLLNLPNICIGTDLYYNLGFLESDGDSLAYSLVPAQASTTPVLPFNIDYVSPYTGQEPMTGITINPHNGQIVVTPQTIGKFNVVVEVREYRNGVHIGTVHYDFLFLVNPCPIPPPEPDSNSLQHVSGGGYPLDNKTIGICEEDDFCFEISFSSVVPSVSVDLSSNLHLLIPGVTETVSGANPAIIQFCGTLPPGFKGGSFIITATDDVCPVYGMNFYTIDFEFRKPLEAIGNTVICKGESTEINAFNDTVYTWHNLSGNVFPVSDQFSCNPCANPVVTPDTSTYYVVVGQYANSTCSNTDTVFVGVTLDADIHVQDETCAENDGVIDIEILVGSGNYTITWQDIGTGPLVRDHLVAGDYQVTITDNDYNCSREESFTLIHLPPPTANAGEDFEVCGLTTNLSAIPSYGISMWEPVNDATYSDPADENTQVTVNQEGEYKFVWMEDGGGPGCIETDTVTVVFYAQPSVQIFAPDSVCGLETTVEATVFGGLPHWDGPGNVQFENDDQTTTGLTVDDYGEVELYIQVKNGVCLDADTVSVWFIEQPAANAGTDVFVCDSTAIISGTENLGTGVWNLPANVYTNDDLQDESILIHTTAYGSYEIVRIVANMDFCVDTDTVTVVFTEMPVVNLQGDLTVCDSVVEINYTLPVGDLTWEMTDELVIPPDVTAPQEISGNYGNHTAILHADNGNGCVASDTIQIVFVVQPQFEPVLGDTVCGLDFELNAPLIAQNHYWVQPANATLQDLDQPNTQGWVETEGNYTFYWVAENEATCRDTAFFHLVFYNQPITDAGENLVVCGLSTQLNATPSYGILLWEDQPGLTFSNPLNPNTVVDAAWYYEYTVVVNEINGICTDSDSLVVEFISTPQILNAQWDCTGIDAEYVLSFDVSLGDTANYQIQGVDGELDNFHFQSYPISSETELEVILYDNGYCGGDTLIGTLFCPIITFSGAMDTDTLRLCGDDLVEAIPASGFALDGNDTLLYAFHDQAGTTLGNIYGWNNTPSFIFSEVLDYSLTYYISAVAGNAVDDGVDLDDPYLSVSEGTPVEFYQLPYGEISGSIIACPYDTVFIPVETMGDLPLQMDYTVAGESHSVTVNSYDFSLQISDSGIVVLTSIESQHCMGNVQGEVEVAYHAIPQVDFTVPAEICQGDTAVLNFQFNGLQPFNGEIWMEGTLIDSFNTQEDSITFHTSLGGWIEIVNFSDQNCQNSDTVSKFLLVKPLPEVSIGNNLDVCHGDTITIGSPHVSGQIYNWEESNSLLQTQQAMVEFAGFNTSPFPQTEVLVLHVELNGCFDTDTALVTTHPTPQPQIIGNSSLCSGDSIWFVGYGGDTYHWSPPQYFESSQGPSVKFFATTDTYIELVAISQAGCMASTTQYIQVFETPEAAFSASHFSGCAPLEVNFEALFPKEEYSYDWQISGVEELENNSQLNHTFSKSGVYNVSLSVVSPNGCEKSETLHETIEVYSTFAEFEFQPEVPDVHFPEVYFTNHSPKGTASTWYINSEVFSNSANPVHVFAPYLSEKYNVCLEVVDANFCQARTCKTVTVKDDFVIYVPNAFTPDGNGINDLFFPVLTNVDVVEYEFWITDSRGRIVFSTTDIHAKWDGSTGVMRGDKYYGENKIYTWHIKAKPNYNVETRYYNGHVLLLR